jgi:hypothetical protein
MINQNLLSLDFDNHRKNVINEKEIGLLLYSRWRHLLKKTFASFRDCSYENNST